MLKMFNNAKLLKVSLVMFDQCPKLLLQKSKVFLLNILPPLLIAQFPNGTNYSSICYTTLSLGHF